MKVAVIGMGSNSLRMLISEINGQDITLIKRYREGLRIFASLNESNNISEEMIDLSIQKVNEFIVYAKEMEVTHIHIFATSAVRDATNQHYFCNTIFNKTGILPTVIDGNTEAYYSFLGATNSKQAGMIDIGGGSTEIATGHARLIDFSHSIQLGAVRLHRMQSIATLEDIPLALSICNSITSELIPTIPFAPIWFGVGGTFTASAAYIQRIPLHSANKIHGFILTKSQLEQAIYELTPMPLEKRLQLPYLQPKRADIIVHGMVILLSLLQSINLNEITVSERGNLEGYTIANYL